MARDSRGIQYEMGVKKMHFAHEEARVAIAARDVNILSRRLDTNRCFEWHPTRLADPSSHCSCVKTGGSGEAASGGQGGQRRRGCYHPCLSGLTDTLRVARPVRPCQPL